MRYNLRTPKKRPSTSSIEILGHDILYQICSILSERIEILYSGGQFQRIFLHGLVALSSSNKALREICIPFIFSEACIHEGPVYPRGDPWEYASRRLKALSVKEMAGVLKYVKIFDMKVFAAQGTDSMSAKTARNLVSVLSRMPKLRDMSFNVPAAEDFLKEIKAAGITFPGVQRLLVGTLAESLIPLCPNVRIVRTDEHYSGFTGDFEDELATDAMQLVKSVLDASNVTELSTNTWTLAMVKLLASKPNKIRTLSKISDLDLIPYLSSFSNLECLKLGSLSSLDERYNPPRCGNFYMGPKGAENRRRMRKRMIEAQEKVIGQIDATFREGTKLQVLVVNGDDWERVGRDEDVDEKEKFRIGNWMRERTWSDRDLDGEIEEVSGWVEM